MKIYMSEKDIDNNELNYGEDDFVEEYFLSRGVSQGKGFKFYDDVGLVEIQSLEQHEQEIRKPLEDEINELKDRIKKLKTANESFANLIEAVQEITGRKDVRIDDIVSLRKPERLKALDKMVELWMEEGRSKNGSI